MKHTTKSRKTSTTKKYHPRMSTIGADADLGIAILIAESATGEYEPLGPVVSINEGHEIMACDLRNRIKDLEAGKETMKPAWYRIWCTDHDGTYAIIYEMDIDASRFEPKRANVAGRSTPRTYRSSRLGRVTIPD